MKKRFWRSESKALFGEIAGRGRIRQRKVGHTGMSGVGGGEGQGKLDRGGEVATEVKPRLEHAGKKTSPEPVAETSSMGGGVAVEREPVSSRI